MSTINLFREELIKRNTLVPTKPERFRTAHLGTSQAIVVSMSESRTHVVTAAGPS